METQRKAAQQPPLFDSCPFSTMSIMAKRSTISATAELLLILGRDWIYNVMSSENSLCAICQEFAEKELRGYSSVSQQLFLLS